MVAPRRAPALVLGVLLAASAEARPLTLDGLTFSDELGGVELLDGWGRGTLDEPFVLVERITGQGAAILIVRGMSAGLGNRIRSHHETGFALTKIVHNETGQPWTMFDLELRERLDRPSPFDDGLSFGQASVAGRPFGSDRFSEHHDVEEPYDGLSFQDGLVLPGESVSLSFVVTDTTPTDEIYLLQRRDSPLAMR